MKKIFFTCLLASFHFLASCQTKDIKGTQKPLYLGGDLSYTNEMEDCGGTYQANGKRVEPFAFFKTKGANMVRVRLWHSPDWTKYANLEDVKKTIKRAKQNKMNVLLDFHYSDTWADPDHQQIPKAWETIKDVKQLGDSLYAYTYNVLYILYNEGLTPEFVQVGNETNSEIMQYSKEADKNINWQRNAYLLNKGLEAVNAVAKKTGENIQTMLHVAQPENGLWWFEAAHKNGIAQYDWIGLSYYPKWSKFDLAKLTEAIATLKKNYNKRVMIVETGYPYSPKAYDEANNVLDAEGQIAGYDYSPAGQRKFMIDLTKSVIKGGGEGVIYWEPTWISTPCRTLWGKGSHWENATFFDAGNNNEALPVFDFMNLGNY